MNPHGFARVSVCSPLVSVANPADNADRALEMLAALPDSDVVVFPELSLSAYTCADLFRNQRLIAGCEAAAARLATSLPNDRRLVIVGAPVHAGNELFNAAIAINQGRIVGIVPKQHIPNYNEFYESRWFRGADGDEPPSIRYAGEDVPFGIDLLFQFDRLVVGVEICEDLWMPIPPSSYQALGGANLLVNLSASNETVAKNEYRTQLVQNQSGRCVAGYAYSSAGPSESTTDLVFSGHCLIAENGNLLIETSHVGLPHDADPLGPRHATADVDIEKLQTERRLLTSFGESSARRHRAYRAIPFAGQVDSKGLKRSVNGTPFVPPNKETLTCRCAEVFGVQCAGLAKRLQTAGTRDVFLGVSGGLDSTLALVVAVKTYKRLGREASNVHGLTMPGFGTTSKTKANAVALMDRLGIAQETIDIRAMCLQAFRDLSHAPFGIDATGLSVDEFQQVLANVPREKRHDLVFENVQARLRTFLLMSRGFVVGTGDMSELALGWCTYNGDHMSMYNPNGSVPKTLVKFLVEYVAEHEADTPELRDTLLSIANTTISPELLPTGAAGGIEQSTEDVLGPYELHDFYLANFVRYGFAPEKILFLSDHAEFTRPYPRELRERTLKTFLTRFFTSQFKRSCVPDGPKVGSVSLSPRGDWKMPSDADVRAFLDGV